jgi:hypothetical protein
MQLKLWYSQDFIRPVLRFGVSITAGYLLAGSDQKLGPASNNRNRSAQEGRIYSKDAGKMAPPNEYWISPPLATAVNVAVLHYKLLRHL